jgi:hypothetical protein
MGITNGNVNIYTPRSMGAEYDRNMPVTTFLRDTFFPGVITYPTENVDVDFRKGAYLVAPFVAKSVAGINMERHGYETKSYTPPRIAPQRPITKEMLETRLPGENLHTSISPSDRQDYLLNEAMQEMDNSITRREELMCSQLLTNGIINVRGYSDDNLSDYIDENINYQFSQKTDLGGSDVWDNDASDKIGDIEDAVEMVLEASYDPRHLILGASAYKLLKTDEMFLSLLDKKSFEYAMLRPELRTVNGSGLRYVGHLNDVNLDVWTYFAWYKDYDGTVKPVFPVDHFVVAPENIGEVIYGAITQLEDDKRFHTYEATRVPKIIIDVNDDKMKHRLSSRPMPRPFDVDAWAAYKVLA